jgi:phenylpropionate dioxygenase-like ring-hydroxylating dioxygenase large terminal subunit
VNPAPLQALAQRLADDALAGRTQLGETATVPVSRYLSAEWLAREVEHLFRAQPLVLAHASEVREPGTVLRHDALGVPLLLVRDRDGALHGVINVCRHRGMRLVEEPRCTRSTLVCPYHGWTYALDGALRHIPHAEYFEGMDVAGLRLARFPVAERGGLVWGVARAGAMFDADAWAGDVAADLDFFGVPQAAVYRRTDVVRQCNWKLVIEAFLEAYHIRVLHRNTIYPFFVDACAVSESIGAHLRSAAARRRIGQAHTLPPERWDLRELCTFTHFVFPNTVLIFHPDYTSLISLYPVAPDRTRWVHTMLVPAERHTPDWAPHWEKTFELIEQGVFQAEDLYAAEGMQAGFASGANEVVHFGKLEFLLGRFHRQIDAALNP